MHYINGRWVEGRGKAMQSYDLSYPQVLVWQGKEGEKEEVDEAIAAARISFSDWSRRDFQERAKYLIEYRERLKNSRSDLEKVISQESGKPLWESKTELDSMIQKIESSFVAYQERCPQKELKLDGTTLHVRHKAHGVIAVVGPFNFPGHLPNGHIVPALLAGNTLVFKGSEHTPAVSEWMTKLLDHFPKGVFNLIQGGPNTGEHLLQNSDIDGLFFTGSLNRGLHFLETFKGSPEKILTLEMGGNNPLVVADVEDLEGAAYMIIQSSFITSGQRCTCARRLILMDNEDGSSLLKTLVEMTSSIQVGPYDAKPPPFMGPVISLSAAAHLLERQQRLKNLGGKILIEMQPLASNTSFLSPGIMDVTSAQKRIDEEIFGPFLQVIRVPSFEAALKEANQTEYGLAASLFSKSRPLFERFRNEIASGVINWNTPTTGASGKAPFGGIKKSGNFRPSGYYAADYSSYPIVSMEREKIALPKERTPGIKRLP